MCCPNIEFFYIWPGSGSISRFAKLVSFCTWNYPIESWWHVWCTLFLSIISHVWYLAGCWRRRKYQILRYHLISVPYICTLLLWSADWLIQITSTYISRIGGRIHITHMSNQKVKKDSFLQNFFKLLRNIAQTFLLIFQYTPWIGQ